MVLVVSEKKVTRIFVHLTPHPFKVFLIELLLILPLCSIYDMAAMLVCVQCHPI